MASTLSPSTSTRIKRRGSTRRSRAGSHLPPPQTPETHDAALNAIRAFLKGRNSYDAFPVSFRVIVLDSELEVKKALQCLLTNGVVSAPLWNSEKSQFAGMFTVQDIIHLIQYYYRYSSYDNAATDVETFRLESLRDIEKILGVAPPPLLREHPSASLWDTATRLIETHARRLPMLDYDSDTGHEVIVSVLTQYRLLKFISINCSKEIHLLHLPLRKLGIGTYVGQGTEGDPPPDNPYHPIATATMQTTVFDVVHMFSEREISAVPIVDDQGVVVNMYESVDVITLVKLGVYQSLDLTISEALNQRSPDFPGVVICTASDSLGTLLQLIKKRRVHRLVVVQGEEEERKGGKRGRLLGILTLSDVLRYVVGVLPNTTTSAPEPPKEPLPEETSAPAAPVSTALEPPVEEQPHASEDEPQPHTEGTETTEAAEPDAEPESEPAAAEEQES